MSREELLNHGTPAVATLDRLTSSHLKLTAKSIVKEHLRVFTSQKFSMLYGPGKEEVGPRSCGGLAM